MESSRPSSSSCDYLSTLYTVLCAFVSEQTLRDSVVSSLLSVGTGAQGILGCQDCLSGITECCGPGTESVGHVSVLDAQYFPAEVEVLLKIPRISSCRFCSLFWNSFYFGHAAWLVGS